MGFIPYENISDVRIANVLGTYDDLIENNKKQIKLLEDIPQRLYKEWFVDLHFPGCEDVENVNGIPLLFVELKKNTVDVQNAYDDNDTDYLDTIPQLFYYNAFVMLSNGVEAKVGTLGSKYEFFHEWRRL